ncbi:MAG: type II toxin-antitoxin system VapC family toxin [Deltaproteobacteria bacterium]|nr:type II toxin-antitoxin system VapC family toxin [Deltaproteobacteria bacterium]
MGLYLDTSCLLKLLFPEPETRATAIHLAQEDRVVVSSLARLEALVQIDGRRAGGLFSARQATLITKTLDALMLQAPYELANVPRDMIAVAEQQLKNYPVAHCRTLDRLHLSAMQSLGLDRILTNDKVQWKAAVALGYRAISPSF